MGGTCCKNEDMKDDGQKEYIHTPAAGKGLVEYDHGSGQHITGSTFIHSDDMKQSKADVKPLNILSSQQMDKSKHGSQREIKVAQIRKNLKDL